MPPSVAIIIPTFNRAELLRETLDSVVLQDYEPLEVLVLDDGSTDGSQAMLDEYAARHPGRMRWVTRENAGPTKKINAGFELVDAQLLGVLSSDDLLVPGAVAAVSAALVESPEAVVAYPDYDLIDIKGDVISEIHSPDFDVVDAVRLHHCGVGPGALFRSSTQRVVGPWDSDFPFCGDFDFWIRMALVGPFVKVRRRLGRLRDHPGTLSSRRNHEAAAQRVALIEKLYRRTDLPPPVLAVQDEALRAAYVQAAVLLGRPNGPAERFVVADRLAREPLPNMPSDLHAVAVRQETELRVAQDALRDAHEEMRRLHEEVAQRDALLADRSVLSGDPPA